MPSDTEDADRQRVAEALEAVKANPAPKAYQPKPPTQRHIDVRQKREVAATDLAEQIRNGTYASVAFPFTDQQALEVAEAEDARLAGLAADAVAAAQALAAASAQPPVAEPPTA